MLNNRLQPTEPVPLQEPPTGLAARLLTGLFFRPASVSDNRQVAPGLHRITLEGPALKGLRWSPGDKLQVRLGRGLLTRTYTPITWDAQRGSTHILAHSLAVGPGSEWVRRAAPGQMVSLFGPRKSLALAGLEAQDSVLVGDETALGLVAAWRPAQAIIEAGNRPAVQALIDTMGLPATALARQANDLHLDALANAMLALAGPATNFVLAGRARTLQHLLRALRDHGVGARRIQTKAYWAEGKTGLD